MNIRDPKRAPMLLASSIGVLAGLSAVGYLLLLWAGGENPLGKYSFMTPPVYAIFFVLAFVAFRDKINGRRLKLMQAFKMGFFLNIFATLIFYGVMYYLLSSTELGGEIMDFHQQELAELLELSQQMDEGRMSAGQYQETKENIRTLKPESELRTKALFFHFSGLLITLIMGMIFRNDPK